MNARRQSSSEDIREFCLPKQINFKTADYADMIDWTKEPVYEPPILKEFSESDLINFYRAALDPPAYPPHSQSVERAVQMVTIASERKIGYENRHRFIHNLIKGRQSLASFQSKKDRFQTN